MQNQPLRGSSSNPLSGSIPPTAAAATSRRRLMVFSWFALAGLLNFLMALLSWLEHVAQGGPTTNIWVTATVVLGACLGTAGCLLVTRSRRNGAAALGWLAAAVGVSAAAQFLISYDAVVDAFGVAAYLFVLGGAVVVSCSPRWVQWTKTQQGA